MIKKDLQRMHVGHDSKDDPRLANLLTPKGDLSTRRLIESIEETVTLTRDGRQEAELQRNRGTRVLGHGNHD
jgi:hypothetical protein